MAGFLDWKLLSSEQIDELEGTLDKLEVKRQVPVVR
jgi:hypothetical protein